MAESERVVLDASALIAFLKSEPGAEVVAPLVHVAVISAVTLSECLSVFARDQAEFARTARLLDELSLDVIPCDRDVAIIAATIHAASRDRGLSLADCMCLATARLIGARAITADRAWRGLDVGVTIEVLR